MASASAIASLQDAGKVKICTGHTRPVCHINYSKIVDGSYWFVTSCHDSKPMLRNGETCDWVGTFEGHRGAVYCSSFSADASKLVTGSGDYSAIVWDALTGANLHTWQHPHYVKSCDWIDDKIVTGCYDSKVRIYDTTNYSSEPISFTASTSPSIKAVYFVDGTNTMVTASEGVVKAWDLRSKQVTAETELKGLNVLEYTHEHTLVAAQGKDVVLLDPTSLKETNRINTSEDVECASLSHDGHFLCVGSKIKAKEYAMDGTELQAHRGHHGPVFHVRYAPDQIHFASCAEDGTVRVWPSNETISRCTQNGPVADAAQ